ncbi:hypothetical protein AB6A40_004111 [Gnathostoma spinigerum]|uniref:Lysosomal-associated transmembrane protein 4A n=1 Tax=Gnathostoma spinigerum TaxID=75299 RepID=A0ABD6EL24_9BILA
MLEDRGQIACCTIRAAGIFVAIVEIILCILSVYGLARNLHIFGASYTIWFIIGIISVIIICVVIVLLLYAIKKRSSRLILPHLFVQIFLILFLIMVALVVFLLLIFGEPRGILRLLGHDTYEITEEDMETIGFMIIVIYLLVAALEVLCLYIVYKLFRYFKEYELASFGDPFYTDRTLDQSAWQIPDKTMPNGRGSPDAGDVYPYY